MSSPTRVRLTSRQRLGRGLKYSTLGPVDVTRGTLGVGADSLRSTAAWLGDRYRRNTVAKQLTSELASAQQALAAEAVAVQEALVNLPQTVKSGRRSRRRARPLLLAAAAAAVLAGGAVTFSILRRSTQPDPSSLPPSVEVTPKP